MAVLDVLKRSRIFNYYYALEKSVVKNRINSNYLIRLIFGRQFTKEMRLTNPNNCAITN